MLNLDEKVTQKLEVGYEGTVFFLKPVEELSGEDWVKIMKGDSFPLFEDPPETLPPMFHALVIQHFFKTHGLLKQKATDSPES